VRESLAQGQGHSQTVDDERAVELLRGIPADDARADERMRFTYAVPELIAVGMDVDCGSRLEADERVAALSISLLKTQRWPPGCAGLLPA